jgi:signal transduction histidine kinase/CheY-like chemotaxis protein
MSVTKEDLIRRDRLDILFSSFNSGIFAYYVGPVVMFAYIYLTEEQSQRAAVWLVLMCSVNTLVWIAKLVRSRSSHPSARFWMFIAGCAGAGWGMSYGLLPYFVESDDPILHMVVMTVTSFNIVAGVFLFGASYKLSPTYYLPITILPAIHAIQFDHSAVQLIGYIFLIWVPTSIIVNKAFDDSMTRANILSRSNEELAEKLRLEKQEAESANLSKSRFLAAASHDLRQPLHALGLFANQLGKSSNEPQTLHREIRDSVRALSAMLDTLLDVSRIDANEVQINRHDLNLCSLLQTIQAEFTSVATSKGLELAVRCASGMCVNSDASQLGRMIRNLISNAIRYTDEGKVLVGVRKRGDDYELQVWDTGIGIAEDEIANVFEEFYQVNNPERDREKGVGLGLSIVSRLSVLLDHRVSVCSVPGKGSRFSIMLPRADQIVLQGASSDLDESVLSGMIALVIDDDPTILSGMKALLESWKATVFTAGSGEEALQVLDEEGVMPDVVLSDYRLRANERGDEVLARLAGYLDVKLKAIIMTGDLEYTIEPNPNLESLTVIHKPVDPDRLNHEIVTLLKS